MLTIQTPRLQLCSLSQNDAKDLLDAINETMDQLEPWMPWASGYKTDGLAKAKVFIAQTHDELDHAQSWQLGLWSGKRFIGVVGLIRPDTINQTIEIGYWCRTSEQNKGYITESINALTRFAIKKLEFKKTLIICLDENIRSASVAERLGFKLEETGQNISALEPHRIARRYACSQLDILPKLTVSW